MHQVNPLRQTLDPFGIADSLMQVQLAWLQQPEALLKQFEQLADNLALLQIDTLGQTWGVKIPDRVEAVEQDIRFQDPDWTEIPAFDLLKQHYLLVTRWLEDTTFATPNLDDKTKRRAAFWLRQFLDAVAPSNIFWTNPVAIRRMFATGGLSLVEGARRWAEHLQHGSLPMVELDAFRVGENLATTPGQVIWRNELLELIQYAPKTTQVHQIPIVIIAPWINKYYILDLNEKKSLVNWLVSQGFTVFITSWKNPTAMMRDVNFADYLTKGLIPALDAARSICQVPQVHALGYCIGGTLLTSYMAWQAQDPHTERLVAHWTLLATLTDFTAPGDIDVFIDEDSVSWLEGQMDQRGYLDGKELAWSFRLLRPNHLVWSYAIQHYLYGEEPVPFDVLYWNMDSTRLPAKMHSFYLREFYLNNKMAKPHSLILAGKALDLTQITEPLYAVGTEQDHIAPWKETFKTLRLIKSETRYVLATSGHILGIISPPTNPPKRRYWVGTATNATDPENWRANTPKVAGSWWEDWNSWLISHCGELVNVPTLGNTEYPPLNAAPGTYVVER